MSVARKFDGLIIDDTEIALDQEITDAEDRGFDQNDIGSGIHQLSHLFYQVIAFAPDPVSPFVAAGALRDRFIDGVQQEETVFLETFEELGLPLPQVYDVNIPENDLHRF